MRAGIVAILSAPADVVGRRKPIAKPWKRLVLSSVGAAPFVFKGAGFLSFS